MSFLDNIGKAAQAAAKKSGELVEVTKVNMNINSEEDKIQKIFNQIGKSVYERFKADGSVSPEFIDMCNSVKGREDTIKGLKQKILDVKNMKLCISCNAEMDSTTLFCIKCGTRQPESTVYQAQVPAGQVCPSCGTAIPSGAAFCTKCGTKIE